MPKVNAWIIFFVGVKLHWLKSKSLISLEFLISAMQPLHQVSKTMGTSVSLVGGGLTIAGGILTVATAGVATPVLIAGGHWLLHLGIEVSYIQNACFHCFQQAYGESQRQYVSSIHCARKIHCLIFHLSRNCHEQRWSCDQYWNEHRWETSQ